MYRGNIIILHREYDYYAYAILGATTVGREIGRMIVLYGPRNYEKCLCRTVLRTVSFGYLSTMFSSTSIALTSARQESDGAK